MVFSFFCLAATAVFAIGSNCTVNGRRRKKRNKAIRKSDNVTKSRHQAQSDIICVIVILRMFFIRLAETLINLLYFITFSRIIYVLFGLTKKCSSERTTERERVSEWERTENFLLAATNNRSSWNGDDPTIRSKLNSWRSSSSSTKKTTWQWTEIRAQTHAMHIKQVCLSSLYAIAFSAYP